LQGAALILIEGYEPGLKQAGFTLRWWIVGWHSGIAKNAADLSCFESRQYTVLRMPAN
jgi:hypothetical protein